MSRHDQLAPIAASKPIELREKRELTLRRQRRLGLVEEVQAIRSEPLRDEGQE
jgi:hypothetical protein